jgi:DME family drug/metabolite transporter
VSESVSISHQAGRAVTLSLLGNGLAGLAGTVAAIYTISSSPAVVGFLRLSIGAISLLVLAPLVGGKIKNLLGLLKRPGIWVMAATSASYQAFFFASVERSGVATAALVTVGCIPPSAGIVGWLILRERPNKIWFLATTVGVTGLVIRSLSELEIGDSKGLLFAIVAGVGIGAYLNAAKIEIRAGGHPMQLPGMAYLLGSLGLLVIVRADLLAVNWNTKAIGVALFLGVVTMGLANALQILGMRGITPGVAATMMLSDPVAAAILGVVVLGEVLTTQGAIGLALVIIGLAMQSFSPGQELANMSTKGRHRT